MVVYVCMYEFGFPHNGSVCAVVVMVNVCDILEEVFGPAGSSKHLFLLSQLGLCAAFPRGRGGCCSWSLASAGPPSNGSGCYLPHDGWLLLFRRWSNLRVVSGAWSRA